MKRIEAVIALAALDDFHRCAKELGIFGFDLSVPKTRFCDHQRRFNGRESGSVTASRIKVDFAVLDEQTKRIIHAVLESVHPESIGVFKFDEDFEASRTHRLWPIHS
jgi:nitrogen regulatory protein PII